MLYSSVFGICVVVASVASFPLDEDVCDAKGDLMGFDDDYGMFDACPAPKTYYRRHIPARYTKMDSDLDESFDSTLEQINEFDENESPNDDSIQEEESSDDLTFGYYKPNKHHYKNKYEYHHKYPKEHLEMNHKIGKNQPFQNYYQSYPGYGSDLKELNTESMEMQSRDVSGGDVETVEIVDGMQDEFIDKPDNVEEILVEKVIPDKNMEETSEETLSKLNEEIVQNDKSNDQLANQTTNSKQKDVQLNTNIQEKQ